jgi:hypothetical protein
MADCTAPTLSVPELGCFDNPQTWATDLVQEIQDAINHLVGCITDFEYPECDICVLKADLVACPLAANMMDFSTVVWGENGGAGEIPYPPALSDEIEFRYGSATITPAYRNAWRSVAVTFSTPFTSTCRVVLPVVTSSGGCPSGINIDGNDYAIMVKDKTAAGCTVWIYRTDSTNDCTVTFDYVAYGE